MISWKSIFTVHPAGIPIEWIKGAGHNSNTDEPEMINRLIERLVSQVILGRET